ncbi:MAG TPA: S8 family serine peptidase, partial [Methanolinea sp.]|nr:S8 family serine peptidase [Methanolinea sp.]
MILLSCWIGPVSAEIPATSDYEPGVLIICFTPEIAGNPGSLSQVAERLHGGINSTILEDSEDLGIPGVQYIALDPDVTVEDAISYYLSDPSILWAEPNYIVHIPDPVDGTTPGETTPLKMSDMHAGFTSFRSIPSSLASYPNDPDFSLQWNLKKIQVPEAWETGAGQGTVVIAVIDTGIDFSNPDFDNRIWTNPGEIPGNGIDDDNNGFIDDVHGWDFANGDNDPGDDEGHGTAVSSVIAARVDNKVGIAGVMPDVRIMPLKAGNKNGILYSKDIAKSIRYARENGARIVVCSFGKYMPDTLERTQIQKSDSLLFVCAAGNEGNNNDARPFYPAGYPSGNIISVAATDNGDFLCPWSNYGQSTVHVGAPGLDIPVYTLASARVTMSGTSFAAPHVAGLAGMVLSKDPTLSVAQLKGLILNNVDSGPLSGYTITGGRVNAFRTVRGLQLPPAASFTATPTSGTVPLTVQFTDTSTGNP